MKVKAKSDRPRSGKGNNILAPSGTDSGPPPYSIYGGGWGRYGCQEWCQIYTLGDFRGHVITSHTSRGEGHKLECL